MNRRAWTGKHERPLPSPRQIRRTCGKELYRAVKRLGVYIPPDRMKAAEELYFRKVALHLPYIAENGSNRKALADWWEENVSGEIAELWEVDRRRLADAFRRAFGG